MGREGCIDLDPMWPGDDGRPRGPTLCVMYPRCECGMADAKTRHATAAYWLTHHTHWTPLVYPDDPHPTCSECGATTPRPVDGCDACRGPLPKGG